MILESIYILISDRMRDTLVKLCALSASSPLNDWYDPRVNTKGYLPHPDIIIINKNERNLAGEFKNRFGKI
jgi:hypothetical protein